MGLLHAPADRSARSPGTLPRHRAGLFAVLAIAAETDTSATYVQAVQVLRTFEMLMVAPALAVFLARLREPPEPCIDPLTPEPGREVSPNICLPTERPQRPELKIRPTEGQTDRSFGADAVQKVRLSRTRRRMVRAADASVSSRSPYRIGEEVPPRGDGARKLHQKSTRNETITRLTTELAHNGRARWGARSRA